MDVAEAVPDVGLPVEVSGLLGIESPAAVGEGLVVVAECLLVVAHGSGPDPGTWRRRGWVVGAVSSTARGEPVVARRRPVTPVQFIPYAEGGRLSAAGRGEWGVAT